MPRKTEQAGDCAPPPAAAPAGGQRPPASVLPEASARIYALGAPLPAAAEVGDTRVIALGTDAPEPPIMGVPPFDVHAKAAESLEEAESTNTPL